jgi:hypothetical protein
MVLRNHIGLAFLLAACGGEASFPCAFGTYPVPKAGGGVACEAPPSSDFCDGADNYFADAPVTMAGDNLIKATLIGSQTTGSGAAAQVVLKVEFNAVGGKDLRVFPYVHVGTSAKARIEVPNAGFYVGDNMPLNQVDGANWSPAQLHATSGSHCQDDFYVLYPQKGDKWGSFTVTSGTSTSFFVLMDTQRFVTKQQIQPLLWFQYQVDGGGPLQNCGGGDQACLIVGHTLTY